MRRLSGWPSFVAEEWLPWLCTVNSPAAGSRLFVKVTLVVCPVGLRIVSPGYVPPYVHMLVQGPSSIWTQASSIPIETFALVLTGGKSKGRENGAGGGVGVAIGAAGGVAPEMLGALAKRIPRATSKAARTSGNKALKVIWRY